MRVPIGIKFIIGFVVVVAAVAVIPRMVELLGYSFVFSTILGYAAALIVGLVLGLAFSRSFTANIGRLTEAAQSISRGDLTRNVVIVPSRFPDETDDLASLLNMMLQSLRDLVGHIKQSSAQLSRSARELNSNALEISASTEEVAQSIEHISRGVGTQVEMVEKSSGIIREMADSVELVAARAMETAQAARDTSLTARHGGTLASESMERMKEFFENQEAIGRQFGEFIAKLQKVGKVADFIGEVARQTNLLALNASIEAARAGEYGKGFAVVAEEVRKLADGSSRSAAEINEMIESLRDESRQVHQSILEGASTIKEGKKNVDVTATAFLEILKTVLETERQATSIAELAQLQLEGSGRMVAAVDEIAKVADDNAAAASQVSAATEEQLTAMQEMAAATRELSRLAEALLAVVERFQVNEPQAADGGR